MNDGCLVDIDSHCMCTPFFIPNNALPLEGCVASLSKYQEPERSYLVDMMRELGK